MVGVEVIDRGGYASALLARCRADTPQATLARLHLGMADQLKRRVGEPHEIIALHAAAMMILASELHATNSRAWHDERRRMAALVQVMYGGEGPPPEGG